MAELAAYLAKRGHEVTILTSHAGPREVTRQNGVLTLCEQQITGPFLKVAGITPQTSFLIHAWRLLREEHSFDVVHCLNSADAFGACMAGLPNKTALIALMAGMPFGRLLRRQPWESVIVRVAVRRASRVIVLSRAAAEKLQNIFHRSGDLLGIPCDMNTFTLREGRDLARPRILGAGAFSERRKGALVLIRAFELVKKKVPGAILQYSGAMTDVMKNQLLASVNPGIHEDIQFSGVGKLESLPDLYGQAAVTVLPSVGEAFGMVLVESLACGTPVVGSQDGGIPDIVQDGMGTLFDPGSNRHEPANPEGLAKAILSTLDLYRDPHLHRRCRESVQRFSWEELGPRIEALYAQAAEDCARSCTSSSSWTRQS